MCLFKQRKINKQNKTVVKIHIIQAFNLPVGRWNSKFHVNFMQHMLVEFMV